MRCSAAFAILLLMAAWACRPPSGVGPVAAPRQPPARAPRPAEAPAPVVSGAALVSSRTPELASALAGERADLVEALDRSLRWFEQASSREYFPTAGIGHAHAHASVWAFRALVLSEEDAGRLAGRIREEFEFYRSTGRDGRGAVLFTGYYAPTFPASRTPDDRYRHPLYRLPDDLVIDASGAVRGRRVGERLLSYPTRADIEKSRMLEGSEVAYLRDGFEAYLVHIQGSAALTLPDGSTLHVGYAGNNGHEYVSVARELVKDGKLREEELSSDEVEAYFRAHPEDLERYLHRNPRYIFFRETDGSDWPSGSLGVRITPLRTVATDKAFLPPGGVTLVLTTAYDGQGRVRRFERFLLDQDSGGAIRTPGRADIYFGAGPVAGERAASQYAEGQLYYLFLKPERLAGWQERMAGRR